MPFYRRGTRRLLLGRNAPKPQLERTRETKKERRARKEGKKAERRKRNRKFLRQPADCNTLAQKHFLEGLPIVFQLPRVGFQFLALCIPCL